ncbi:hypothetical protein [Nonomuraea dietziae]|uniref:Uncharacterized protein n=1 Tax=Nonomuraea dietziae TaxID=65515 RepID=A0A7W5VCX0_9ACTN|nr:hypothetical protein [Nonomuraea dietziae]MBB3725327.1 hypothetical protein [Nonomuraea dietziae]
MQDLATRRVDGEFAELICADDQWLRETFDALIAASYGPPPAGPWPPAPPRTPPTGPSHRRLHLRRDGRMLEGVLVAKPSGLRLGRSPPNPS